MIGNYEMEVDPPFPLLLAPQETSIVINDDDSNATANTNVAADTSVVILDSPTPMRVTKKRKISISTADQNKNEDDSSDAKKTMTAPLTPTFNVNTMIKNDMKRLLQSQDCEISKYYQIKSNIKLVLIQGNSGEAPYRNHPETIKELSLYFDNFRVASEDEGFNFVSFIKEKHAGLIAKLVQDSQVPQSELLSSLKTILFPLASGFKEFPLDSSLLEGIVEKVSYGHPEAGNNFTSWSCTFWQVKDLELLGDTIGKHFLTNYVIRNAAKMMLETALKTTELRNPVDSACNTTTATVTSANVVNLVDELPMNLMKIESGTGTPKKKEKKEKQPTAPSSASASGSSTAPQTNSIPQVKISSFFAKLKKPEGIEKPSGEYFQPFFVKPDVTLAPLNQLKTLKLEKSKCENIFVDDLRIYWNNFKEQKVKIPFERQTCLCVGYDGRPIRTVLKLLKFEENYRPAYLGTWLKSAPKGTVGPRRPFAKITEIDYEYDSDAEWDEGEDPEGESLSDLDDEEEDEEDDEISDEEMETLSNAESADSWLVPHGYLSDDEGVDEVHPGELEDAAREAELMPPSSTAASKKSKERRKFVPKEPMLLGPFLDDQVIPQCLQGSTLQFIKNEKWIGSPFANYEAVFAGLEGNKKSSNDCRDEKNENRSERSDRSVFPENLLSSLIQIITLNPSAGVTKLYDEFILQHGKIVSRRLFESKLNQITTGKMKCEKTGKLRWIFKEEFVRSGESVSIVNDNAVTSITTTTTSGDSVDSPMQID